jgi:hypothetical protein
MLRVIRHSHTLIGPWFCSRNCSKTLRKVTGYTVHNNGISIKNSCGAQQLSSQWILWGHPLQNQRVKQYLQSTNSVYPWYTNLPGKLIRCSVYHEGKDPFCNTLSSNTLQAYLVFRVEVFYV